MVRTSDESPCPKAANDTRLCASAEGSRYDVATWTSKVCKGMAFWWALFRGVRPEFYLFLGSRYFEGQGP